MDTLQTTVLDILKEKANKLNQECQTFQKQVKRLTNEVLTAKRNGINDLSRYQEEMNRLFDDYSLNINRLNVECLLKSEQFIKTHGQLSSFSPFSSRKRSRAEIDNNNDDDEECRPSKAKRPYRDPRPFKCKFCPEAQYTAKSSLLRHVRKTHGDDYEWPKSPTQKLSPTGTIKPEAVKKYLFATSPGEGMGFPCSICDQSCPTRTALKEHLLCRHNDDRPHGCKYCDRKFKLKRRLYAHIRNEHGECPFECKQCGQSFKFFGNFRTHRVQCYAKAGIRVQGNRGYDANDSLLDIDFGDDETEDMISRDDSTNDFVKEEEEEEVKETFTCGLCSTQFSDKKEFAKHLFLHKRDLIGFDGKKLGGDESDHDNDSSDSSSDIASDSSLESMHDETPKSKQQQEQQNQEPKQSNQEEKSNKEQSKLTVSNEPKNGPFIIKNLQKDITTTAKLPMLDKVSNDVAEPMDVDTGTDKVIHQCKICDKLFKNRKALGGHMSHCGSRKRKKSPKSMKRTPPKKPPTPEQQESSKPESPSLKHRKKEIPSKPKPKRTSPRKKQTQTPKSIKPANPKLPPKQVKQVKNAIVKQITFVKAKQPSQGITKKAANNNAVVNRLSVVTDDGMDTDEETVDDEPRKLIRTLTPKPLFFKAIRMDRIPKKTINSIEFSDDEIASPMAKKVCSVCKQKDDGRRGMTKCKNCPNVFTHYACALKTAKSIRNYRCSSCIDLGEASKLYV